MEKNTLVMKFGGTSVGSPEALDSASRIVASARQEWKNAIVVVSALSGVTNLLLSCTGAGTSDKESIQLCSKRLYERHVQMIQSLLIADSNRVQLNREIETLVDEFSSLAQAMRSLRCASTNSAVRASAASLPFCAEAFTSEIIFFRSASADAMAASASRFASSMMVAVSCSNPIFTP